MNSPTDSEADIPNPPEKPTPPILSMLENRLNEIEAAFNAVIETTEKEVYSLAHFVVAAREGLMALSAVRDFLPYLKIKDNAK